MPVLRHDPAAAWDGTFLNPYKEQESAATRKPVEKGPASQLHGWQVKQENNYAPQTRPRVIQPPG